MLFSALANIAALLLNVKHNLRELPEEPDEQSLSIGEAEGIDEVRDNWLQIIQSELGQPSWLPQSHCLGTDTRSVPVISAGLLPYVSATS